MAETLYHCESQNVCGYCRHHCKSITVKQMRKHECLQKQCYYLEKNLEHEYWAQRARAKAKRVARKEKFNNL